MSNLSSPLPKQMALDCDEDSLSESLSQENQTPKTDKKTKPQTHISQDVFERHPQFEFRTQKKIKEKLLKLQKNQKKLYLI